MVNQNAMAATEFAGTVAAEVIELRQRNVELLTALEYARQFVVIYALPAAVEKQLPSTENAARILLRQIYTVTA